MNVGQNEAAEGARGPAIAWAKLYDQAITREKIPCAADEPTVLNSRMVYRQPYVDLGDAVEGFRGAGSRMRGLSIYADVVHIPRSVTFAGSLLRIFARRVEAQPAARILLDQREDESAKLELYALERPPDLESALLRSRDKANGRRDRVGLNPAASAIGVIVRREGDAFVAEPSAEIKEAWLAEGQPLLRALMTDFHLAAALEASDRMLAISMLRWIRACTAGSKRQSELRGQCTGLLLRLERDDAGVPFVPSLRPQLYSVEATKYARAASAWHDGYLRFVDERNGIEQRKKDATRLLDRQSDTVDYVDSLIAQARLDMERTRKARILAERRVEAQHLAIELQRAEYQRAIDAQKRKLIASGVFKSVQAVVGIAQQIPAIVTGSPQLFASAAGLLATAVEASAGMLTAIQDAVAPAPNANPLAGVEFGSSRGAQQRQRKAAAAKAAERMKTTKAAADTAKALSVATVEAVKLEGAIDGILSASSNAAAAASAADDALASVDDTRGAVGNAADPLEGIGVVTGGKDEWELLQELFDMQLAPAEKDGVSGTADYRYELRKLLIYGRTVCECRLAYAEAAGQYARLALQRAYEARHVDRLKGAIEQLGADVKLTTIAMQDMYLRYLGVKRGVFLAVDNYTRAFFYWALKPSTVTASMNRTIPEMANDLAKIASEYNQALTSFDPRPQMYSSTAVRIENPSVLESLRKVGSANWQIEPECKEFRRFDRVRLETVSVRLLGATTPDGEPVTVVLTTSGRYRDRRRRVSYDFVARPLWWLLKYRGDTNLTKSMPPVEMQQAYFEPTPFSDWTLMIPREDNATLDLSKLSAVELTLSGSFIGQDA